MKIGELARATGVDVETIRYYERVKLLPVPKRLRNRYRDYGERHLEHLAFIRHCRALDMPLGDIRLLLDLIATPSRESRAVHQVVKAQLNRVRARLKSLRALQKQLTALRARMSLPKGMRPPLTREKL